jgi:hypothetical protein
MSDNYSPFSTPPLLDRHNKFVQEARESIDVLTRCIRCSIMLAEKIAQQPTTAPSPAQHTNAARDRIRGDIEEALHRNDGNNDYERPLSANNNDGTEAESLKTERPDRLDEPDPEDDLAARPIAHIIADICRDLGLDALPASNPQKDRPPPPPLHPPSPANAPQAAAAPVTKYRKAPRPEAPTPAKAHQPAPPTPFPRL